MRETPRKIELSRSFNKDFGRELTGRHAKTIAADLDAITSKLAKDEPLPVANKDHPLTGPWAGYRDCHVHPNLVLIYAKPVDKAKGNKDLDTLVLVCMDTHSNLF
jgi:mRNA interferase YafQ